MRHMNEGQTGEGSLLQYILQLSALALHGAEICVFTWLEVID
jgi:hypothetical protein